MDVSVETSYHPPAGFVEDKKDPLIDLGLTDSTELWLIQWPINQPPDFDGQQVSLNLHGDGHIGTLEGSSGKSYDMVSYKSQGPETTVFVTSTSEAKIAANISRRVSLIHYPEPSEFQRRDNLNLSQSWGSSGATSTMSGRRYATPSRSIRPTKSQMCGYSTPSSRTKSSVSGFGEPSKPPKRKRVDEKSKSISHSAQDSGKGNSVVTSTGSLEHSQEEKEKQKLIHLLSGWIEILWKIEKLKVIRIGLFIYCYFYWVLGWSIHRKESRRRKRKMKIELFILWMDRNIVWKIEKLKVIRIGLFIYC